MMENKNQLDFADLGKLHHSAHCMLPALLSVTALAFAPYPSSRRPIGTLPLFVITVDHLNSADKSTLQTLSGLLARDSPRIYTLENTDGPLTSAYALWLEQLTDVYGVATNMTYNRNFPGLLALFTNGNGQSGAVRVCVSVCLQQLKAHSARALISFHPLFHRSAALSCTTKQTAPPTRRSRTVRPTRAQTMWVVLLLLRHPIRVRF